MSQAASENAPNAPNRRSRYLFVALGVSFCALIAAAERDLGTLPFLLACAGLFATLAYTLSGRLRFSLCVAACLMTLSTAASMAKYKLLVINAHVFDIWFFLSSGETLKFIAGEYAPIALAAAAGLGLVGLLCGYVWRRERPAGRRMAAGTAALASMVALPLTLPSESNEFFYHIRKTHFASSFFASFADLARLRQPGPMAERLGKTRAQAPYQVAADCELPANTPDIFLVLSESAVPPAAIPGWNFDPSISDYFKSWDGQTRGLRVETHGGGTWISHTSLISGMSMADFGWMRSYATTLLRERLNHGLAAALKKCGYHTAVLSSQSYQFVAEGPMLTQLGFEDYIDREKIAAPSKHETDDFYFGRALDYYKRHIATDGRPLFMFIMTMAAHSPYDFKLAPQRQARGAPFGNDAETDEYLRRLTFAQEDYRKFLDDLGAVGRPVLATQFGDHHPVLTRAAFERAHVAADASDWRGKLYDTFYAVTPVNFTPAAPLPSLPSLDIAYLGGVVLDVAGIPLDPVMADKRALRAICDGAFHTCADRAAVNRHLARMQSSGYLREPDVASDPRLVAGVDAD